MADAGDLKSLGRKAVRVRSPPPARRGGRSAMGTNGIRDGWRTPGKAEAFAGPPAPSGPEPEADLSFSVLLDAPRWAVAAKSGNLPCHPGGRYRRHTLECLLEERAGFPAVHFVSRLDRETSGCVLVAKDAGAAGAFGRAMETKHANSR